MAVFLTVVHGALAVLFSVPAMQDRAETWEWAWEPVGGWKPLVVVIPLLVAVGAMILAFRSKRALLAGVNVLGTLGWGWLLTMHLLSSSVA